MDRRQRIRIVIATVTGVISFFIATVGAEMAGAGYVWSSAVGMPGDPSEMEKQLAQMLRLAQVGRIVIITTVIAWAITCICGVYLLEVWAKWFIGPKEELPKAD